MTLRDAAKGVVTNKFNKYNIGFRNSDGDEDETQFHASDLEELEELWSDFCKENSFWENSVAYVEHA